MTLVSRTKEVVVELRQLVKVGNILKVEAALLVVVLDVGYDRILNNFRVLLLRHWGFHYGDANG